MYDFKQIEEEIIKAWEKEKTYEKVKAKNKKGKKFYFLQGPPYTSGRLHIGHAWNNALKDVVLRYKRMQGFNVWDRAGYDMHGLPTENAVQKKLGIKDKLEIEKYGVEKFIRQCIEFSSENAKIMDKDLLRLGIWMDYKNAYWPIKTEFIEGEWWLMKKAWEQKRLYKGKKIMHWCGYCETSLAKHELEYDNVKENSIFLKFKSKNKDEYFVIFTTTPWTIPFNLAVMVNPELDYVKAEVETKYGKEKWIVAKALANVFISGLLGFKYKVLEDFKGKKLEGIEYIHPLNGELKDIYNGLKKKWKNTHTIILSKEYVDASIGSGLVHCAPGCGPEDYEVGKKYGLDAFNLLDEKGFLQDMGKFSGLRAKKEDKKFIEALKDSGSLITETEVEHEYAHCWRCHNPVIFRATEQWFMKIEDLIPKLLKFNKEVNWEPEFASKNYDLWIENLKDNGITRQRYWGCPVPIWQCASCNNTEVIGSVKELKSKAKNKIPKDLHKPWIDEIKLKCSKCKKEMSRIPDVIDVWIDSGTASWNCLYYPHKKDFFKLWPADFILEATEQIKLWFSMLQMCSAVAFGKSCYKNVYSHGMILDYQGMKMSKSLGNIISPYGVVDKYGADILRYYMCETPAGENISFNWESVKTKQGNLNILYNIANFIKDLEKQTKPKNTGLDAEELYILSRKNSTIRKITELMEEYKIDEIIPEIEKLFLDLSRIYIKMTREKINSNPERILYIVKDVYLDVLKTFSIICPFISDKLWKEFNKESVHLSPWPEYDKKKINSKLEEEFAVALNIIEKGLAERDKLKIGLKWPLAKATVYLSEKSIFSKDLNEIIKGQLNVKEINIKLGKKLSEIKVEFDTKTTPELEAEGYARNIARQVQGFRKKLTLVVSSDIQLLLQRQEMFIKDRTNAIRISITSDKGASLKLKGFSEDKFNIKDREIIIYLKKNK
ncbi:isoleucine--tRNA ligase [Candidatus Pacearchaeota archaeon]|nr:isoleucine--tRNA ligase [Candidatus Pacearchaeota archaeon]